MKEKLSDCCRWKESCDCHSIKNIFCESCTFYKFIDSGYGWCKGLPEPIVVAWCKDICSLFKR